MLARAHKEIKSTVPGLIITSEGLYPWVKGSF